MKVAPVMAKYQVTYEKDEGEIVLGKIMLENEFITNTFGRRFLGEDQKIYLAMLHLHLEETPIDLFTLVSVIKDRKQLNEIGGIEYIMSLVDKVDMKKWGQGEGKKAMNKEHQQLVSDLIKNARKLGYENEACEQQGIKLKAKLLLVEAVDRLTKAVYENR